MVIFRGKRFSVFRFETVEFFASLLHDDASLLRLLDADYTYLNEPLAKLYRIEGVQGPAMFSGSEID